MAVRVGSRRPCGDPERGVWILDVRDGAPLVPVGLISISRSPRGPLRPCPTSRRARPPTRPPARCGASTRGRQRRPTQRCGQPLLQLPPHTPRHGRAAPPRRRVRWSHAPPGRTAVRRTRGRVGRRKEDTVTLPRPRVLVDSCHGDPSSGAPHVLRGGWSGRRRRPGTARGRPGGAMSIAQDCRSGRDAEFPGAPFRSNRRGWSACSTSRHQPAFSAMPAARFGAAR